MANDTSDIRIADSCRKYGYKIVSVPEIIKKSYYTFIRFNILKDGNVVEVENLFDNCYEGYDEMVEYLDEHFVHDNEEAREDKSSQIRKLLYIGLVIIIISSVLIVVDNLKENSMITTTASLGILVGIGFIGGYLNEKLKR